MSNKIKLLVNDYRNSSWKLRLFALGLLVLGLVGNMLPVEGYASGVLMIAAIVALIYLWASDSRRRYRLNRDTLYGWLLLIFFVVVNAVSFISSGGGTLYEFQTYPDGGFAVSLHGLLLLPLFALIYLLVLPISKFFERRENPLKASTAKRYLNKTI